MGRVRERPPRARQRGATTVEFALVVPVFFAVLFGTIDLGRLVVSQVMLSYAVNVGARLASVSSTTAFSTVQTTVAADAPLLNIATSAIHYQIGTGAADSGFSSRTTGAKIRVYTTYTYKPLFITALSTRTLSASGQAVIQ